MNKTLVLIGPAGCGKSTLGQLLAERLGFHHCPLDDVRIGYYEEIGYDKEMATRIRKSEKGVFGLLRYWDPFEVHAVERVLEEYRQSSVIDFGAGHSVYEDEEQLMRVEKALESFPNVVLLLPAPDLDRSVEILNARFAARLTDMDKATMGQWLKANEHFVRHPSNRRLAKIVAYTEGKTPEETCDEILRRLSR